jgi:predicted phage-related endonuclease
MGSIAINSEAEWLALREQTIGGSEVSGLFATWLRPDNTTVVLHAYEQPPENGVYLGSCSPYTTGYRLFLAKAGKVMPDDFNPSERMQAGTFIEPAIAQWAMAKWEDWKLRKVRRYSLHPTIAQWGASVDYEVHGAGMEPVEIKNVDFLIARDQWVIEGDTVISAPLHIMLQLQHYIAARGAEGGWLVVCVGGNTLARGRFAAHAPTAAFLANAIEAFWAGVRADTPPIHAVDFEDAKDEFRDRGVVAVADLANDPDATMLARSYTRWKQHADRVEAHLGHLKGALAVKVGENTKAVGDGFRVTWPQIERAEAVVPQTIRKAMSYRGAFTVTMK